MPARAAICGFKMTLSNGTIITAVAKEREEAKREHDVAIRSGKLTGLVEYVTDDGEFLSYSRGHFSQLTPTILQSSLLLSELCPENRTSSVKPPYVSLTLPSSLDRSLYIVSMWLTF